MNERRVVHLKGSSSLGPKCGATDASIVTNWVLGATYHEVYVPADVLQRADLVCERCQDAALADDSGSDDEVVPDTEEEDSRPAQDEGEDRVTVEAREHRAEERPGLGARDRGGFSGVGVPPTEQRRRHGRAENEHAADQHRERQVIQELENVEVERLHSPTEHTRNFRPHRSV